ncbi:MAG: glycosyltransferase [Planctomycetes bacterium]|nr:glycosyltransferase [Planctomycetota bacterium]
MKILLCHNHYQQPGGEDQVFQDERWLLESHGHDVIAYTRHNDEIGAKASVRTGLGAVWSRAAYREVRDLLCRRRPDVMHCTNVFPLISPAVYYAARAEGVPVVQSLHNFRLHCVNGFLLRDGAPCEACVGRAVAWRGVMHGCYRDSRAASAVVAATQSIHGMLGTWRRRINLYVAVSRFAREKFIAAGMPAEKIVAKPNFVHPDDGPGDGGGGYVAFVGRLSPEKGIGVLLEAWSKITSPLRLKIVGDGPRRSEVENAARRNPRIEALGRRPLPEVLDIVGGARLLVMPSIWYETFGRTVVEGFAKGTPALVSRLGAMRELVEEGRTGMCFEPGNAADLAAKVMELDSDEDRLQQMRRECRSQFESKYTAEANYRQLIAIYERAGAPQDGLQSVGDDAPALVETHS